MSYTRTVSRDIVVPYSYWTYEQNLNGDWLQVKREDTTTHRVNVEITVETDPFEESVEECNEHINILTGSVAAMEASQCAEIAKNATQISNTVLKGFFHTVRTELETQRVALKQAVEAKLILLNKQAQSLKAKQAQMEQDYSRTSSRYLKIFDELNQELENRIHEVDQPVFKMVDSINKESERMLATDLVQTTITTSKESSEILSQLNVATIKKNALQAMSIVNQFLLEKAKSENVLKSTLIPNEREACYYIPVCMMETNDMHSKSQKCVMPNPGNYNEDVISQSVLSSINQKDLKSSPETDKMVNDYFQEEINKNITDRSEHSDRVRGMITKMYNK